MISSPGVGSGLDVNTIVSKLMAVESIPLNKLNTTKQTYQDELSAYGKLSGALSAFQTAMGGLNTPSDFKLFSAASSDTTVFTASADSTAGGGTYNVAVNRIAEQHKLGASTVYADTGTTTIGTAGDSMTITVGSNTPFTVSYGGQTLSQIRDSINSNSGNVGVTASIVHDTSGYRLLLSANDTGSVGYTSVSYSGTDPFALTSLNKDRNGDGVFTSADLNAQVVLDGTYTISSSSNTVTDMLTGVTLNLTAAGTSTLTLSRDTKGITAKAQAFVDAYNSLQKTMSDLGSTTLQADNTLRSIQNQVRDTLNTPPSGISSKYSYLAEVGLSIQKDGTMALDPTAFAAALNTDPNGVADLFGNNNQGYGFRLKSMADQLLQTGGLVDTHQKGINTQISSVQTQIDSMTLRLQGIQQRYQAQYTALDQLVANLQTQGNYLTQQLASLPTIKG